MLNAYKYMAPLLMMNIATCSYSMFNPRATNELHLSILSNDWTYRTLQNLINFGADVNAKIKSERIIYAGVTPLHVAATFGDKKLAAFLIDNGAHINALGSGHITPLLRAADSGRIQIIQLLISKGAQVQVDTADCNGSTALMCAVERGCTNIVKLLLEHGADINLCYTRDIQNYQDTTPKLNALSIAAQRGHIKIVKLLFEHGATVNDRDGQGWTALHRAVVGWGDQEEMVKFLIDRGADPSLETNQGETVFDLIQRAKQSATSQKQEVYDKIFQWCKMQFYELALFPIAAVYSELHKISKKQLPRDILFRNIAVKVVGTDVTKFKPIKPLSDYPSSIEKKYPWLKRSWYRKNPFVYATSMLCMLVVSAGWARSWYWNTSSQHSPADELTSEQLTNNLITLLEQKEYASAYDLIQHNRDVIKDFSSKQKQKLEDMLYQAELTSGETSAEYAILISNILK